MSERRQVQHIVLLMASRCGPKGAWKGIYVELASLSTSQALMAWRVALRARQVEDGGRSSRDGDGRAAGEGVHGRFRPDEAERAVGDPAGM